MTAEPDPRAEQAKYPGLAGRAAIVTGGSRGIGCGIARVLAGQGMRLVLAARSADRGEAFAQELRSAGADAVFVAADLSTPDGARAVVDAAVARCERVDLLVNNAALLHSRPFNELDEDAYRASFEANVRMVYGPSFLAVRHMADRGGGCIVHISSVGGLRAHRRLAGYDASKGAIDALTRSMALDLAPMGIRVNAVAPGATRNRPPSPRRADYERQMNSRIPLGRRAEPEEIGHAVAFLASDAAAYITGQILYVDGGLTAQLTPPGIWV